MFYIRQSMGLLLLGNGKVLAAGGDDLTTGLITSEIYDPSTGSWSSTGSSFYAVKNAGFVVLSSSPSVTTVLRTGGQLSNNAAAPYSEIYDSSTGAWATTGSLNTARFSFGLVKLSSGNVLAFAGSTLSSWLTSGEKYDVATGVWSFDSASLNTSRAQFATAILSDGKILAIGGYNGTYLSSVEIYTP